MDTRHNNTKGETMKNTQITERIEFLTKQARNAQNVAYNAAELRRPTGVRSALETQDELWREIDQLRKLVG